jgi:protein SCO1/2
MTHTTHSAKKEMSNSNKWKKYIGLIGILFLFPLTWLLVFGVGGKHNFNTLKYYGPEAEGMLDSSVYIIPPFVFQNQDGEAFSSDSLKGKIWLAAFYSMNNPHIKDITDRLLTLNFRYRKEPDIYIVSFSTDCDYDQPAVLKPYIEANTRYNEFPRKWQFLTGDQQAMGGIIRNGFLLNNPKEEAIFRLIDDKGHIRGLYGNTEFHFKNAIEDIALLKKEIDLKRYHERKAKEKTN